MAAVPLFCFFFALGLEEKETAAFYSVAAGRGHRVRGGLQTLAVWECGSRPVPRDKRRETRATRGEKKKEGREEGSSREERREEKWNRGGQHFLPSIICQDIIMYG